MGGFKKSSRGKESSSLGRCSRRALICAFLLLFRVLGAHKEAMRCLKMHSFIGERKGDATSMQKSF
jgi:hypothetical protein